MSANEFVRHYLAAFVLLFALATAGPTSAQTVSDPGGFAQARALVEKLGKPTMRPTIDAFVQALRRRMETDNPGKAEAVGEIVTLAIEEFDRQLPTALEPLARTIAQQFTSEELAAINQFYETPVGQKYLAWSPTLLASMTENVGIHLQVWFGVLRKMTPEIERRGLKQEAFK